MQAAKDWFGAYRIRFTATMAWMSPLSVTDWGGGSEYLDPVTCGGSRRCNAEPTISG